MGAWLPAPASLKSSAVRKAGGIQGVGGASRGGCPLSAPPEGCMKSSPENFAAPVAAPFGERAESRFGKGSGVG